MSEAEQTPKADGTEPTRVRRRGVLVALGIAGAAATLAVLRDPISSLFGRAPADQPGPAVASLFGELGPGTRLDRWTIVTVHDIRMGAIPVVLATANGRRFQVDVLARDHSGEILGVGNTTALSLFVSNQGNGSVATDEEQGLGAIALADALARREAEGAPVPELLTLPRRLEEFPEGSFSVGT